MFWKYFQFNSSNVSSSVPSPNDRFVNLPVDERDRLISETKMNLRKIAQLEQELRETRKVHEAEIKKLYLELIDIVDSLDSLIEKLPTESGPDPRLVSRLPRLVGSIYRRLLRTLELRDVVPINEDNDKFDSRYCQVVEKEYRSDLESGTIVKILRQGFTFRKVLLRPHEVIISQKESG